MDKVIINNQVVHMRKFVKQAKIRTINKYTKEIRKLQNWKGNEVAASKHKRKAERLLAKVSILRKIQPDAVSKKAMMKEKDWEALLKEKNSPLEDQCYALLANYAEVRNEVEKFYKKYWDLVPKINTLFKGWEEKNKDPRAKQERKKIKQLQKSTKNNSLSKNNPNAIPVGKEKEKLTKSKLGESLLNIPQEDKNMTILDEKSSPKKLVATDLKLSQADHQNNKKKSVDKTEILKAGEFTTKNNLALLPSSMQLKSNEDNSEKIYTKSYNIPLGNSADFDNHQPDSKDKDDGFVQKKEDLYQDDVDKCYDSDENRKSSDENDSGQNMDLNEMGNDVSRDISDGIESSSDEDFFVRDINERINLEKIDQIQITKDKISKPVANEANSKLQTVIKKNDTQKNIKIKVTPTSKTPMPENKLKAVAMVNLNELLDLDEIPIQPTDVIVEEVEECKRKRDSFFLGQDGKALSESEDETSFVSKNSKDSFPPHKKQRDSFGRNDGDDSFKKKIFPSNSRQSFKQKECGKKTNSSIFEDKKNSFKNKDWQMSKSKSREFPNKAFNGNNLSQFRSNAPTEMRKKDRFMKNNPKNSLSKNTLDDKPLHPSWEAKRKLKEAANTKFQGKRIVFDDLKTL